MNDQSYSPRMNKIINEINEELHPIINQSERKESMLKEKLMLLNDKLLKILKIKCSESFNWLEKNKSSIKDGNLSQDDTRNLREFQECVSRFDYGLKDHFLNSEKEIQSLAETHNSCCQSCEKNQRLNDDDSSVKICLKKCFNNIFQRTDVIQQNILKKVDEVIMNLNKI